MTERHLSSFGAPGGPFEHPTDEARELAIRILTEAFAYDVITDFEFERRLGQLGLATTPATLDAVVADLSTAGGVVRDAMPDYSSLIPTEGRIVGIMSETRRKGPWRVPQRLTIRAIMCDMKIDLRYAAIPPGCSIHVRALMSNVSLIAPPGLIVDFNVDPVLGAAGSDADGGTLAGHGPAHVRINGSAIMAEVRVRVRSRRGNDFA